MRQTGLRQTAVTQIHNESDGLRAFRCEGLVIRNEVICEQSEDQWTTANMGKGNACLLLGDCWRSSLNHRAAA